MFSLFPITRSHIEYFDSFAAVINSCELLWELERAEKCFLHSLWQNTLTARLFPQCYPLNLTQITAGISLSVSAVISKTADAPRTQCAEREREGKLQVKAEFSRGRRSGSCITSHGTNNCLHCSHELVDSTPSDTTTHPRSYQTQNNVSTNVLKS